MKRLKPKYKSLLLTCVGACGVISTSVLCIKATPKAIKLLEQQDHELTTIEKVQVAWKPYIPAMISGTATILCIFGANYLSNRTNASLVAAYNVLNTKFDEYRNKLKDVSKIEQHDFEADILKSKLNSNIELDSNKQLFFDYNSMTYFQSTMADMKTAENLINYKLYHESYATLNDLYEILGVEPVTYGYQMGWSLDSNDNLYGYSGIKFEYEPVTFEDGLECTILTITCPPSWEYFC